MNEFMFGLVVGAMAIVVVFASAPQVVVVNGATNPLVVEYMDKLYRLEPLEAKP